MNLQELSDNAFDIGTISGVLRGIELTQTLLPNQKQAIADARKALERIEARNKRQMQTNMQNVSRWPMAP